MKIDLKKLKKVSSDKHKTVLQHPHGHQIVVAHKGLKKANLEALSKLPKMYKNPENVEENTPAYFPNFANGGDVLPQEADIFQAVGSKARQKMMKPDEEEMPEDDGLTGDEAEALERGYGIQEPPIAFEEVEATPIAQKEGAEKEPNKVQEAYNKWEQGRFKVKLPNNKYVTPEKLAEMYYSGELNKMGVTDKELKKAIKNLTPEQRSRMKMEPLLEEEYRSRPTQLLRGPASEQPVSEIKEPAIDVEKQAARKASIEAQEAARRKFGIPKKSIEEMNKIPVPAEQAAETNVGPVGPRSPHTIPTEPTILPGGQVQFPQRVPQAAAPMSQQPVVQMPPLQVTGAAPAAAPQAVAPQAAMPQAEEEPVYTPTLQQVEMPPSVIPQQAPKAIKEDIFGPAYETRLKAAQLAEKAAQQKFGAEAGLAQEQFKAYDIVQNRLNRIAAEQEKVLKDQEKERQDRIADVQKGLIDPYKVIRNMSTGDKILASISLILGGMGAGLTHQPNLAYDMLKDAINRDVDAQAKNLGVKENLLNNSVKYYGDLLTAKKNIAATYMDMTNQILERGKAANLPFQKQAEVTAIQSKLMEDIAKMEQEIAVRQAMKSAMTMGGGEGVRGTTAMLRTLGPEGMKVAEDVESKYVPGVGMATVAVPPDIRKKLIASKDMTKKLNDLINFSREHTGTILNRDVVNKGKAMAELVRQAVREAKDMGVIKDSEVELMNKLVSDPTKIWASWRAQPGYKAVLQDVQDSYDALLKGYDIREQAGAAPAAPAAPVQEKMPPPPKGTVYMMAPDGKTLGTIPKENVQKAIKKGFKLYKGQ